MPLGCHDSQGGQECVLPRWFLADYDRLAPPETSRRPRGLRSASWTGWERLYGQDVAVSVLIRTVRFRDLREHASELALDPIGQSQMEVRRDFWGNIFKAGLQVI
jgi:hypothetical protein